MILNESSTRRRALLGCEPRFKRAETLQVNAKVISGARSLQDSLEIRQHNLLLSQQQQQQVEKTDLRVERVLKFVCFLPATTSFCFNRLAAFGAARSRAGHAESICSESTAAASAASPVAARQTARGRLGSQVSARARALQLLCVSHLAASSFVRLFVRCLLLVHSASRLIVSYSRAPSIIRDSLEIEPRESRSSSYR